MVLSPSKIIILFVNSETASKLSSTTASDNLANVIETKEIKLNQISINKLSDEEKAIAINKGWTITTA